eukprot:134135-Pelagomonas_calceolata.AAC.2
MRAGCASDRRAHHHMASKQVSTRPGDASFLYITKEDTANALSCLQERQDADTSPFIPPRHIHLPACTDTLTNFMYKMLLLCIHGSS